MDLTKYDNGILRSLCYRTGYLPGERSEMLERLAMVDPAVLRKALKEAQRQRKIRGV